MAQQPIQPLTPRETRPKQDDSFSPRNFTLWGHAPSSSTTISHSGLATHTLHFRLTLWQHIIICDYSFTLWQPPLWQIYKLLLHFCMQETFGVTKTLEHPKVSFFLNFLRLTRTILSEGRGRKGYEFHDRRKGLRKDLCNAHLITGSGARHYRHSSRRLVRHAPQESRCEDVREERGCTNPDVRCENVRAIS